MSLDKDRAKMLRAIRGKSAKCSTPEETQKLARTVVNALPDTAAIKREAERIRKALAK